MGPLSPPFTGQSVMFTTIRDALKTRNHQTVLINISNKNSIVKGILLCFEILYKILFVCAPVQAVYFTCSRTMIGSVRDVVLLLCCRIRKFTVVNHLHGADFKLFYNSLPRWYRCIIDYTYRYVDTSIVLIHGMESEFSMFEHMRVEVVPNCYLENLNQLPQQKPVKLSNRLLFLSNLIKSKGIVVLLEAVHQLLREGVVLQLDIAGGYFPDTDMSASEMQQWLTAKMDLIHEEYPNTVHYHGTVKGQDKIDLLWDSDIFILPTFYTTEALPVAVIEAMRAGNYIITTTHNYLPNMVGEENGTLVQPQSVNELAVAIRNILVDTALMNKVQNHNIQFAQRNYQEQRYIDKVLSYLC